MNNTIERKKMNGKPVFTVPSKTIINFKSGFAHKLLCDGPTFSAGTACNYSCSFCYVPAAMQKQAPWLEKQGVEGKHKDIVIRRENAVDIVRRQLNDAKGINEYRVIYGSPLVDVAGNMELVRETVEICKTILELTRWDIRLLSKSNLLPKVAQSLEQWGDLFFTQTDHCKRRVVYGVSTGTLDDGLAKAFEQGAPLVSKRIESLRWLQDNGFRTFGMVCPSLPQEDPCGYTEFAIDMAEAIRYDKCEHVWAEVLNARGESFQRTYSALWQAGYTREAELLKTVSEDKAAWEAYARSTFSAHTLFCPPEKRRFLQYVTKDTRPWWESQKGAVLL